MAISKSYNCVTLETVVLPMCRDRSVLFSLMRSHIRAGVSHTDGQLSLYVVCVVLS
jgi:hypothetical protein